MKIPHRYYSQKEPNTALWSVQSGKGWESIFAKLKIVSPLTAIHMIWVSELIFLLQRASDSLLLWWGSWNCPRFFVLVFLKALIETKKKREFEDFFLVVVLVMGVSLTSSNEKVYF